MSTPRTVVCNTEELDELVRTAVREEIARMQPPPAEVLTTRQAAELLHVHPKTLLARAKRGEVPMHRAGREPRFMRDELLEYVRTQRKAG